MLDFFGLLNVLNDSTIQEMESIAIELLGYKCVHTKLSIMSGKMYRNGVLFGSPLLNVTTTTALTMRNILYTELLSGGSEKFNFRVIDCNYVDENKLIQTTCVLWYYTSSMKLSVNYAIYPIEQMLIP